MFPALSPPPPGAPVTPDLSLAPSDLLIQHKRLMLGGARGLQDPVPTEAGRTTLIGSLLIRLSAISDYRIC